MFILLTLISAGGVQGELICGVARLWLLLRCRQSFLEMILPGLVWPVLRITDERKESELPEPEPELVTPGMAPELGT